MTNAITLELDIAWDYYDSAEYKFDLIEFAVADKLIMLEGPAGGNPLVKFTAPEENIRNLLTFWQYEVEDIDDRLEA